MSRPLVCGTLVVLLSLNALAATADEPALLREKFTTAIDAIEAGDLSAYRRLEMQLRDYPLHPYLEFEYLRRNFHTVAGAEVRGFMERTQESPIGRKARALWLNHLATTDRWSDFLADYTPGRGIALECRQLEALYRTGNRSRALAAVPDIWVSAESRPKACDPIFELWRAAGGPTARQAWERFRLATLAGRIQLSNYLKRYIPETERPIADLWIDAHRHPAALLESGRLAPTAEHSAGIANHAMQRWARMDAIGAAPSLAKIAKRYSLSPDAVAAAHYEIAVGLAVDGHPLAPWWLVSVPAQAKDETIWAWSVRAGLRKGDWHATLETIERMPEGQAVEYQWRYWRARALEMIGEVDRARPIFEDLAGHRDYFGFLAADRLGRAPQLNHSALQVDSTVRQSLRKRPAFLRARELYRLRREPEAQSEWNHGLQDANAPEYRAAAQLAHDWGWSFQAIATIAKANDWDDLDLRFPLHYRERILSVAARDGIEPAWIFGVLRQESMFHPTIRSRAGATGLMQIMPATGRLVARDLGIPWAGHRTLTEPDSNIGIGSRYLRMTLDSLGGRHVLATAGYNAGPARVSRWLRNGETMPADVWIELVPYRETRRYLRKVLEYTVIYQHRLKRRPDFIRQVMMPVQLRQPVVAASARSQSPDRPGS